MYIFCYVVLWKYEVIFAFNHIIVYTWFVVIFFFIEQNLKFKEDFFLKTGFKLLLLNLECNMCDRRLKDECVSDKVSE